MKVTLFRGVLAAALVVNALAANVQNASSEFRVGMDAIQSNNFAIGFQHLEQAISEDPDNSRYASEYRQAIIRRGDFDRSIDFFGRLLATFPNSSNLHLNHGFAYVDKIPSAGSITQVILANMALGEFSRALELQPSWLTYYTRGASYLFWPRVFNKTPLGIADLEKAMALQREDDRRSYYVRTYIALGDGFCKLEQNDKAREIWRMGLDLFPDNRELKQRLSLGDEDLAKAIENNFDPNKRVDTDLREVWSTSTQ